MDFVKTWIPAALNANGLANDVTYASGGYALTANDAADGLAHIISILGNAATNHSAKTFTVAGTDADGNSQTEGIAGPNGNVTVTTTKYFKTVSMVTVSATTGADTFDIGWTAVAVTQTVGLEKYAVPPYAASMTITGTINLSIQETPEQFTNLPQQNGVWSAPSALASKTASFIGNGSQSMRCVRGLVNSVTAGATMRLVVAQGVR